MHRRKFFDFDGAFIIKVFCLFIYPILLFCLGRYNNSNCIRHYSRRLAFLLFIKIFGYKNAAPNGTTL